MGFWYVWITLHFNLWNLRAIHILILSLFSGWFFIHRFIKRAENYENYGQTHSENKTVQPSPVKRTYFTKMCDRIEFFDEKYLNSTYFCVRTQIRHLHLPFIRNAFHLTKIIIKIQSYLLSLWYVVLMSRVWMI